MKDYVEMRNGGYYIKGKRVSLDSIVYGYRRGQGAESIQNSFPTLTLEEVYGGLAFYFGNQDVVDSLILEDEIAADRELAASIKQSPDWYRKMQYARELRQKEILQKV